MIAQALHAYKEFSVNYPEEDADWYNNSNYIVVLQIENEDKLKQLISKAEYKGIKYSFFREPDLDNQLTAVAFEPGISSKQILRKLSLALS